jgi:hypothetical protein
MWLIDERVISVARLWGGLLLITWLYCPQAKFRRVCQLLVPQLHNAFERHLRICVGGVVDSLAESPNLEEAVHSST